jgi:hypothetical protein
VRVSKIEAANICVVIRLRKGLGDMIEHVPLAVAVTRKISGGTDRSMGLCGVLISRSIELTPNVVLSR